MDEPSAAPICVICSTPVALGTVYWKNGQAHHGGCGAPVAAVARKASPQDDPLSYVTVKVAPRWPWMIGAVAPYVGSPEHFVFTFVHERGEMPAYTMYGTLADIANRVANREIEENTAPNAAQLDTRDHLDPQIRPGLRGVVGDEIRRLDLAIERMGKQSVNDQLRISMLESGRGEVLAGLGRRVTDAELHAAALQERIDEIWNRIMAEIHGSPAEDGPVGLQPQIDTIARGHADLRSVHDRGIDQITALRHEINVLVDQLVEARRAEHSHPELVLEDALPDRIREALKVDGKDAGIMPPELVAYLESIGWANLAPIEEKPTEESWSALVDEAEAYLGGRLSHTNMVPDTDDTFARYQLIETLDLKRAQVLIQLATARIQAEGLGLHRVSVDLQSRGVNGQREIIEMAGRVESEALGRDRAICRWNGSAWVPE